MIVGYLGWNNSNKQVYPDFCNIYRNIRWSDCLEEEITFGHFFGSILIDNRLPLKRNDYLYTNEEKGILFLIEGFVYNQKELSQSSFQDNKLDLSLPELLFNLFISKGHDFVKDLNGDFAICIYQKSNNSILFFRDHVGIRPLAIAQSKAGVYFSTDPMALCKALNHDEKAETEYLKNLFLAEGHNYLILPNKDVRNIPPAHYLNITHDNNILKRYWFPQLIKKDRSLSPNQVIFEMEKIVTDAVKIRSDHRFKASAHVSGGIDSGVVAVLARKEFTEQNEFIGFSWSPTYSVKDETVDFDERLLVEGICNLNNIIPVYIDFTEDDQILQMKSWRYPSELIFENKVVEMAEKNAVNLIFSGWGGDEFISIGHRGLDADLIRDFSWRSFLKKYPLSRPKRLVSSLLFNALFPAVRRSFSRYKTNPAIYRYIKNSLGNNFIPRKQRFKYTSRQKVHIQLLHLGHLADRTKDWYVHGQQNGIEYRYPLLDKRIIEYMLTVPSHCLVGGSNYRILLRVIGREILPEKVKHNNSKDDPVKSHFYSKFTAKVTSILIKEFNIFRSNPELDFVDFELLEKDIQLFLRNGDAKLEKRISSILYCLKSAHEFSKGYNDLS